MDTLQAKVNRELIKFAVQRTIFCPSTDAVLDVRQAVLITPSDGSKAYVCTAAHWDSCKAEALRCIQEAKDAGRLPADYALEVLDGRDYYLPSGRARAASKIAA